MCRTLLIKEYTMCCTKVKRFLLIFIKKIQYVVKILQFLLKWSIIYLSNKGGIIYVRAYISLNEGKKHQ